MHPTVEQTGRIARKLASKPKQTLDFFGLAVALNGDGFVCPTSGKPFVPNTRGMARHVKACWERFQAIGDKLTADAIAERITNGNGQHAWKDPRYGHVWGPPRFGQV
jgi:hypothetical protein